MNTFFGLPAHPLLVHVPVVLIPLSLLGVILMVLRPTWRRHLLVTTTALTIAGALGAILAAQAGEWLQEQVPENSLIHDHAELGEMARNLAILFAGAMFVWCLRELASDRGWFEGSAIGNLLRARWVGVTAIAGALVFGSASTFFVVRAGHTGAKSAWQDKVGGHREFPRPDGKWTPPAGFRPDGDSN